MENTPNIQRRALIGGGAALVGLAAVGGSAQAEMNHAHHGVSQKYADLIRSTNHCRQAALVCEKHCVDMMKDGDTSLADCLASALEMLPIIEATHKLAIADTKRMSEVAALCAKFCADCAEVCKKHAKKHKECKDCYDACIDCEKACRKVA